MSEIFARLSTDYPHGYPYKKQLDSQRFAYVVPLTFGRGRICVTTFDDLYGVHDFY